MTSSIRERLPILIGLSAAVLVLGWQAATVHFNYSGHWSALFCIGDRWPLPAELKGEAFVLTDNPGYDGVFYHLVAHDPWLERGFSRSADNPSLRWRRILVPAAAHLLALGRDGHVHGAYIGVHLLFVFLGTCWLARYCVREGIHAGYGFGFLAVPAVLVSVDRLTIDTALAALTVGLVLFTSQNSVGSSTAGPASWKSWAVLVLCPLARETGLALIAGRVWLAARNREGRRVLWWLATAIPFVLWAAFVFAHTPRDGTPWLSLPLAGILRRTLQPLQYQITGRWVALAAAFDYLAVMGIWVALGLTAWVVRRRVGPIEASAAAFALGAIWLGKADIWAGAYEFGRTMSPLLILLGLVAVRERNWWYLLPAGCALPRIALQFEPQLRGILRAVVRG